MGKRGREGRKIREIEMSVRWKDVKIVYWLGREVNEEIGWEVEG